MYLGRILLLVVFLLTITGCSVEPGPKAESVQVSGKVTMDGKSLSGVVLNLHVITTGSPATIPLTGADFKVKLPPGRYTWYISEGKNAAAFTAVPKAYREAAMDRAFDLAAGSTLDLKVTK
ncbi:MAG: hypothetical protein EBV06_06430 [Planctomycetia bacterium]|nr:hypothetical protein [Planctomycetia bacterium]